MTLLALFLTLAMVRWWAACHNRPQPSQLP